MRSLFYTSHNARCMGSLFYTSHNAGVWGVYYTHLTMQVYGVFILHISQLPRDALKVEIENSLTSLKLSSF